MKSIRLLALAGAMAVAMNSTAASAQKADFAACDGRLKPKKSDDGMRGEAARKGYSPFAALGGVPITNQASKISACTLALNDPRLLPTQTLRRAHLLRERAAAYLASGKSAEALADLDAAEAAVADRKGEKFFDRSMGVSLSLLRAIGLAQQGQAAEAARLGAEAAAARPYALEVQMASAMLRQVGRSHLASGASPFAELVRIEPAAARTAVAVEVDAGNFAAAAALAKARPFVWPATEGTMAALRVDRSGVPLVLFDGIRPALDQAFALAATGEVESAKILVGQARREIDKVLARVDQPSLTQASIDSASPSAPAASSARNQLLEAIAGPQLRLAEARIALAEGRAEEALAMTRGNLPVNAATLELLTALRAEADAGRLKAMTLDPAALAQQLGKARSFDLSRLAETVLIAPETPRSVIDYEKSRPNILGALVGGALSLGTSLLGGIERTAGFRSTDNADGSVKVEFTGSTTSGPMVQEMTLLRAAELAKAAGKPRFAVLGRKDYTRFMVTTQYGAEISRVPVGYKSELDVRYLDENAEPNSSLDAVAVIDALGPLYYGS